MPLRTADSHDEHTLQIASLAAQIAGRSRADDGGAGCDLAARTRAVDTEPTVRATGDAQAASESSTNECVCSANEEEVSHGDNQSTTANTCITTSSEETATSDDASDTNSSSDSTLSLKFRLEFDTVTSAT